LHENVGNSGTRLVGLQEYRKVGVIASKTEVTDNRLLEVGESCIEFWGPLLKKNQEKVEFASETE